MPSAASSAPQLILILLGKDSAGAWMRPRWCFQHQCNFRVCGGGDRGSGGGGIGGGGGGGSGSWCWGAAWLPVPRDLCTTGPWVSRSCAQKQIATAVLLPSYVILQAAPISSSLGFSGQIWHVFLIQTLQQQ